MSPLSTSQAGGFALFSRISAVLIMLVGALVLLGWAADIVVLKSIVPGLVPMMANTAAGFVLAGASLWLLRQEPDQAIPPSRRRLAWALAAAVTLLGLLTLGEYAFGWELGLDQLLFKDSAAIEHPGRMAIVTAVGFVLCGAALLVFDLESRRSLHPAELLALLAALIGLLSLVAYGFGAEALYRVMPFSGIALHAAFAFLLLGAALLGARPRRGITAVVAGGSAGGAMARRLLPAAILAPVVLGWLRLQGERAGWYEFEFGLALFALSNVAVFIFLIGWNARVLARLDVERLGALERFIKTFHASPIGISITTMADGRFVDANEAQLRMFGYRRDELIGRTSLELGLWVEPRARERLIEQVRATGSMKGFEAKIRRRDGEIIDTVAAIETIELNGERYLLALTNDVTDIKRSELALKQSEERFSKAFRASPVGIVVSSLPEGRIIDANDAYLAMFGYRRDELIGRTAAELDLWADPEDRATLYRHLEERGRIRDFEARFRKKSGETGFSLASAERIELNGTPCLLSLMNDITERKRAEQALRARDEEMRAMTQQMWQAAKLATMGELAASVAHELNNPLGIVSLRVESLLTRADADESARKPLEVIQHEIERMGALVANLLNFSRRATHQISTLDLREEIARTLELMLFHLRKCNVRIAQEIAPDLPMIQADRQLLRQVFLNLFTNACDAMPQGGTLTIRAAPANADVLIEVADTGVGIPPEDLPKVTEPFYTTKPEGRGTGLGLAICRRVVQEHHGTLEVLSQGVPGKGTTVRIRLPRRNGTNGKAVRSDA